ncbi:MAG: dihydrofolate reductase family protein [Bacteroidia bacterium]|nr:dihydrofolate reductase family protein [Bacteroidia bacterium]
MRKVIAAINMTLDGYCDHTAINADEELHQHYATLLTNAGVILYGRKTYQLMQFWQSLIENPSGQKSMDDFAIAIDKIQKIVFSNTLQSTGWQSAIMASTSFETEISLLKQQTGKNIFIGSRSLITQALNYNLLDELQLCIHPVVTGNGIPLFENVKARNEFILLNTKILLSGAMVHSYKPQK